MKFLVAVGLGVSLLFSSSSSQAGAPTTTTTTTTTPLVSKADMDRWAKVAWCESHGNWAYDGPRYDGGLGISRVNWVAYGGHEFAPAPHLAKPEEQVFIAQRIEASHGYAGFVPDQDGKCTAW